MGKAEFAADLNNLSNRMAQLENSLDAKIDSLVSSYLSRNGIWNGSKQTILTSSFIAEYPCPLTFATYEQVDASVNGARHQLFVASKTGLAFIDYCYRSTANINDARWGYTSATNILKLCTEGNWYSDLKIFLLYYFTDNADNILGSTIVSSGYAFPKRPNNFYDAAYGAVNNDTARVSYAKEYELSVPLPTKNVSNTMSFFVEKGKTYYCYFYATVGISFTEGVSNVPGNNGNLTAFFISANVY